MAFAHTKLAEANEALASGNVEAGVLALVELWGKLPSTRVAGLVIKLSSRLPVYGELPTKVAEREAEWISLASSADPKVVPTLLSVEWPVHPRGVKARIDELQKFPPDPRLAHALRELWLGGRYRSQAGGVFWRRAFRLLLNWKDPQATALIDAAKSTDDGYFIVLPIIEKRTKTPLPTEPVLAADIGRALDEIEAVAGIEAPSPVARASKESLLQAVYDEPSNDAPRLVLADFLLQQGDPRGELIQLMHAMESGRGTGKVEARVKSLLRASGKKWLDGIGSVVEDYRFRCGFASEVTLHGKLDPSVMGWRTVETLHLKIDAERRIGIATALAHPNLRAATHIDGVPMSELCRLAETPEPRSYDRIGVVMTTTVLTPVLESKINVRHLGVSRGDNVPLELQDAFGWFETSAFRRTTKIFEVAALETGVAAACMFLEGRPSLESVWLRPLFYSWYPVAWEVRISRDPASGKPSRLDAIWHGRNNQVRGTGGLGMTIRRLPENLLTDIVLRDRTKSSPAVRDDLARDLRIAAEMTQPRAKFATAFVS